MPTTKDTTKDTTIANLALLRGTVRGEPVRRDLPSGSVVLHFDLATVIRDPDGGSDTVVVPVAWTDGPTAGTSVVVDGTELLVIGEVRRRFFRVGGATQSRTEVVATTVTPLRRRKQVATAMTAVVDSLVVTAGVSSGGG